MAKTRTIIFKEDDGSVPLLDWMDGLDAKAQGKLRARFLLLGEQGYEMRRPHADTLRDGIYELRAKYRKLNLRVLYFFHGRDAVVLSHGIVKQQADVPDQEINRAIDRMQRFQTAPERYSYMEFGDE